MRKIFEIIFLVLSLVSSKSWAESDNEAGRKPAKVTYEKNTRLNFDEAVVDGQFQNPDAQLVDSDRNVHFDSLIELKKDFKRELKRSSGAIR